jgi:ABC-type uncharacterized transport system substrate-binding protein
VVKPKAPDLERLDRQAAHLGNVVRCRRFAPHCAVAHDVDAQGQMRGLGGDVDGVRSTLECKTPDGDLVPSRNADANELVGVGSSLGAVGVGTLSELDGKRQELLMEAVPGAPRIAILADPTFTYPAQLQMLEDAARAHGVEPMVFTAGKQAEIAPAMDKSKASGATALNVLSGPLFSFNRRVVIERAAALRLPAIYEWPEMAEEGGLIAYGPRLPLMYRQAARLVAKVLQGVKPQDIPVELPSQFDLVVNLATAKALGLTIPESFLVRADKVIE